MKLIGYIKLINQTEQASATFRKREMVLITKDNPSYPQNVLITFMNDKCDLLNSFYPNQKVEISINIQGREWVNPQGEVKYFNTIQGWAIQQIQEQQQMQGGQYYGQGSAVDAYQQQYQQQQGYPPQMQQIQQQGYPQQQYQGGQFPQQEEVQDDLPF
ncbi:MAG: DUF3127 domain-containing protein [Flavobacteriaceae bacterium]|jgi:hypothetical protein|nr:DUF3127 domain-containing protein [Flavobacteriaceae bacterium]